VSSLASTIRRRRLGTASVVGLVVLLMLSLAVTAAGLVMVAATPAGAAEAGRADQTADEPPRNGRLPPGRLVPVGGVHLTPEAANAFAHLLAAAEADGVTIGVTDGYRSYERQVRLKQEKGWLAAHPGTSMHGWGLAIDFDTRVTDFAWLRENAHRFGWVHPPWAQPGGSKPEPWHWEYIGSAEVPEVEPVPAPVAIPVGDLVATARLEPAGQPAGGWFDVHHGLEGVEDGARHYPGTALPGEDGNFAIAGYQRDLGGPLAGLDELQPGDDVRVRTADGDELVYEVVQRADLGRQDGWAVGADPLGDGGGRLLTLTTGGPDDGLRVVWARLTDS
jgi:hypothetical protein